MKLKIAGVGEAVLRDGARPLRSAEIGSGALDALIEHMRETLRDAPGVGLAAPQVGEAIQLLIVEDKAEYHANLKVEQLQERERRPIDFHVLINPVIEILSTPDVSFFEGCLSLPGFVAMVPRARSVRVHALDQTGKSVQVEAEGWYARILQHEIDHLNGTLYIDRMWSRSFSSISQYDRHLKQRSQADLLHEFRPA